MTDDPLRTAMTGAACALGNGEERLLVRSGADVVFLKPGDIDWIEADGDYMVFHVGTQSVLARATMARLEACLDPARFVRIHRSSIVNVGRLSRITPASSGDYIAVLGDGTRLKLSRGYHARMGSLLERAL